MVVNDKVFNFMIHLFEFILHFVCVNKIKLHLCSVIRFLTTTNNNFIMPIAIVLIITLLILLKKILW